MVFSAINLQEHDNDHGDPNILIIDEDARSPLEELTGWVVSLLLYAMMLMSGLLMFLSIKVISLFRSERLN